MVDKFLGYILGDIGGIVTGKTPSTKDPGNFGGGIPFVTPRDMDGRKVISKTERGITLKGAKSVKNAIIPAGSVMLSCIGSDMGKAAIAGKECVTNQQINSIIVNNEHCSEYIYYNLSNRKKEILEMASGSAQPILNKRHFSEIKIALPPLQEQRAIAHILGTLDDKIELNRQMNETLEAMARAIFKSWFVDFDPVRAKAEGRDPGLPKEIAALFPDSFQDSELGPIPEGWEVFTVGDLCEFAYGKALKANDRVPGIVPVFGSNGRVGWHDTPLVKGPGIIIGRKGNPGTVTWASSDFFPIDTTFYVVPKRQLVSLYYLFYSLKTLNLPSLSADSAVPGLNRNMVYMSNILLPYEKVLTAFDFHLQTLFEKVNENIKESETLADIRDILLPKLISGEIQVPDAEKFIKEYRG